MADKKIKTTTISFYGSDVPGSETRQVEKDLKYANLVAEVRADSQTISTYHPKDDGFGCTILGKSYWVMAYRAGGGQGHLWIEVDIVD